MFFRHRIVTLSSLTLLVAMGCRSSDPLAGAWSNDTCYGASSSPADIESCSVELVFTDALDVTLQADWVSMPATAEYQGCSTTRLVTGQT